MTMQDILSLRAGRDFAEMAARFLNGEVTLRDICEARKKLVRIACNVFAAYEFEVQPAVRELEKSCGLL